MRKEFQLYTATPPRDAFRLSPPKSRIDVMVFAGDIVGFDWWTATLYRQGYRFECPSLRGAIAMQWLAPYSGKQPPFNEAQLPQEGVFVDEDRKLSASRCRMVWEQMQRRDHKPEKIAARFGVSVEYVKFLGGK